MRLIEAFVRNPVKVAVGVLLVALFGFIGLLRMPMQLTPEVQVPRITISTRWLGASPEEIEREIVQEQEEQLKGVEGLTKMSSECSQSSGLIELEFPVGTNLAEALLKVNTRLQQVREYPIDADEPIISTSGANDSPIAWFILRPRAPAPSEIEAFQRGHPDLAELLEPARRAAGAGLRALRLRRLAEERPELASRIGSLLPPDIDVPTLRRFAEDNIEAAFERVAGVSNANVHGGREDEMQVIVDPRRLAARNLTISDVRNALAARNRDTTAGDVWDGKRRYVVRVMGQFRRTAEVADAIIARRDGMPVYVRDVAEVRLGYKKPTGVVKNFGTSVIAINCMRETGANVLETMRRLRETTARLNRDVLARRGLELVQTYDETDYIYSAVRLVDENIVYGSILTVVILLLFLRSGRSTLVIALAIPTSLIGTFLILHALGRSLNVISLAGLAFAVGMLVDNAVVVLENIYRHHETGQDADTAAVRGAQEVWGAVVASSLTTLAVFLPVLFVEEEAGQLFRDIALAISSAVGLSLVVSITVIPTAAARLLRRAGDATAKGGSRTAPEDVAAEPWSESAAEGLANGWSDAPPREPNDQPDAEADTNPTGDGGARRGGPDWPVARARIGRTARAAIGSVLRRTDRGAQRFIDAVVRVNAALQGSVRWQLATATGFVAAAALATWLLMPPVEYLPNGNRNLVFGQLQPPSGLNLDHLVALGNRLERETQPYWDIAGDEPSGDSPYPAIHDFFFLAGGKRVVFGLRAVDPQRAGEFVPLVQAVGSTLPGTITRAAQSSLFGRGASIRTIDVEITGPSPRRLVELGGQVLQQVGRAVPDAIAFPVPSLDLSTPELHLAPKWEKAADMGIDKTDLDYSVAAMVDGAYAGDYDLGGRKIDLTIVAARRLVERTQDLKQLPIATARGDLIPLSAVVGEQYVGGPEQINRRERQRAVTISVTPPDDVPLEQAIRDIEERIVEPMRAAGDIGGDYQVTLAGTADKLRATWTALRWNFVLALLITYLLMAALFESWLYPLAIILSVPLGAVGGLLGLRLLNWYLPLQRWLDLGIGGRQNLDVLTMLGFVILVGTVVNNPILIVHQSLNHMRLDRMRPDTAILESVRNRIRPIFMTTSTTVLGLLPLVVMPGAGSELYRGLGAVVLGGLAVSTVFTLVLVPTLFSLLMHAKSALLRRLGRLPDEPPPARRRPSRPRLAAR